MKRSFLVLSCFLAVMLAASSGFAQWNPKAMAIITQCELANGSVVDVASNAQIGPGVGIEPIDAMTVRVYFASDDIPTVLSPGQYDLYYVDYDIPTGTWGMAHSINLICDFALNTSAYEEQPRVSPGGQYLFYIKPGPGGAYDHQIWVVEKNASGLWSNPRLLPSLVNSGHDTHNGCLRNGTLYFYEKNRDDSNCGFDMWAVDYDPLTNTASNLEKVVFGTCSIPVPPDTASHHDALIDGTDEFFQWYQKSVAWNTANDGFVTGITSDWYEAIISGAAFDAQDNPAMTFRIYRGTSSNHMGGFTDTAPNVSSFHYGNIDIGIYIHSTGSIRPTWDVNNSSYWGTTLPVGYYDVRVQLDGASGVASFAIQQVANWDAPPADFAAPYWTATASRPIGGTYYIQINPYNTASYVYDVWSGPSSSVVPAPPLALVWDEGGPWVTPDGNTMYFQIYGAPGTSGQDVFVSERVECEGGSMWGTPVILGSEVNGSLNETCPAVTEDGNLLFFSSNSYPAPSSVTKLMYCTKYMPVASISGVVTIVPNGTPAYGVTLALYREVNGDHVLVADALSAQDGSYAFANLSAGDYAVEIVVPLGFLADVTSHEVALAGSDVSGVNFNLNALVATNNSVGMGKWKHEVNVVVTGKGQGQEDEEDIRITYPGLIFSRFYQRTEQAVQIEGVTYVLVGGVPAPLAVEDLLRTLSVGKGVTSLDKAKMQYLALLLNVVSGKVGQQVVISADGATVSQAIVYIRDQILIGTEGSLSSARAVAGYVNDGILVPAGVIPLGTLGPLFASGRPTTIVLDQNWPNPFNPTTTIGFTLKMGGDHELAIYDVRGALVKVLSRGYLAAGSHTVKWDGTNSRGEKVASGMYLYLLKSGNELKRNKMILLR